MRFEKWQALGNDYVLIAERDLPWELTAERVRAICARHFGCQADGILLLSEGDRPGLVAKLRIFNPDGSEAELSGNGAREAALYLRRSGWTDKATFSIETKAGEIRPTILSETTCRIEVGRAKLQSDDFPGGGEDGAGLLEAGGREWRFQHLNIGNPQCVIDVGDELDDIDLSKVGPEIEHSRRFPNRTNVAFVRYDTRSEVTARIFERGVGETLSSGTGASASAVAFVLNGGSSPVTVHLQGGDLSVEVDEDLNVALTGWAVPVFSGEFSQEFMNELEGESR